MAEQNRTKSRLLFASTVVENSAGDLLLVREGKAVVLGKYNLPGGNVEDGELLLDCAVRELMEETGLRVVPDGIVGIYEQSGGINIVFHACLDGCPEAAPGEDILACEWLSKTDIAALHDNQVLRLRKLRRILADLEQGHLYPLELIRSIPQEAWECGV